MSWKDVLVLVADARIDEPAIALAEEVARRFEAQLCATFLTPLPDEPLAYEPTVVAGVWAELLGRARAQSEAERAKVAARISAAAPKCELKIAEALSRDLGRVAALHARYADIAVLARSPESDHGDLRDEIVEGVLFHSGRPALVAPPNWPGGNSSKSVGKRILVAWDASREATRALADASPFIDTADSVAIVTVDAKPKMFGHGDTPGAKIAAHLTRRGAKVEVRNIESKSKPVSLALMDEARALNADLIVMGGYSSSRLREMVFGGATRDLLRTAEAPLLMSH
ncbi:MAG: universal stress protein [Hyphomonadaceae bacterium]|nr:universal stress protein [Hyphomonadaceae bacterium]